VDGQYPTSGVVPDGQGNITGVASGGTLTEFGTMYRLNANGGGKVLHTFGTPGDGSYPVPGLLRDSQGNFYGATTGGGTGGNGTVWELSR
jgi:uncharacterized repeat protein (TIGR03803 family)